MNILENAEKYAEGKANQAITKAIADAYVEGYKAGYKDREEEKPMEPSENKTEYVDLGLPSGTLWASDYEKSGGKYIYLPYEEAKHMKLPTEKQWDELEQYCNIIYSNIDVVNDDSVVKATVTGPNRKSITLFTTGFVELEKKSKNSALFWLHDEGEAQKKKAVELYTYNLMHHDEAIRSFSAGFKLPIRLVR